MNQLTKVFNFGSSEIRTIVKADEVWFVAKDVCEALDIKNTSDALKRLDEDEVTRFNLGGLSGETNLVNEPGLYSLILGSRKEEAKQFKRWITHEVIPAIRKTGSYQKPQSQLEVLQLAVNQMVEMDKKLHAIESSVETISHGLTAVPDSAKVVERVNEYARYTRMGHDEIYNSIYQILKAQHGIDVKARVENERRKINADYYARTGKLYAESTLKKKVNGVDVMVRMGALDKFNSILVGLLAKAKGIPTA